MSYYPSIGELFFFEGSLDSSQQKYFLQSSRRLAEAAVEPRLIEDLITAVRAAVVEGFVESFVKGEEAPSPQPGPGQWRARSRGHALGPRV